MTRVIVIFLFFAALLTGCSVTKKKPPQTVPLVDLQRYAGVWYEIAAYPTRFEEGCFCITAEYTPDSKGKFVRVMNRCRKGSPNGPESSIRGKAFVVRNSGNARLKVQFFWPFRAPYWVVGLADDYSWALVSGPSKEYLWILSRTPQMDQETYMGLLKLLQDKGFDTNRLRLCDQSCGVQRF
ncbi:MAG TPA: lipocalin family protein [Bacteroidales bacterium]|nr:lipocalin family protein [Bacteroidales bacterium]HRZ48245.1 lipocalin family protein [Bacteroidales bacterium]